MAVGDNDSFIREVNEDIRQENLKRLWRLLRPFILGGAAAIVLITAGVSLYSHYMLRRAEKLGDAYNSALEQAAAGAGPAAFAALAAVENSGFGGYPVLARFRAASLLAQKGDKPGAVAAFDAAAADKSWPLPWREAAMIRAAWLLVDSGNFAAVEQRVGGLANDVNPMRLAAREALGLTAWKAGDMAKAAYYFNRNYSDKDSSGSAFAGRAAMMLGLIGSEGAAPPPAGAAAAGSPAAGGVSAPASGRPAQ